MVKKRRKTVKKEPSWPELGATIAAKIEKEHKKYPEDSMWKCSLWAHKEKSHFFSALVFAIAAIWTLGELGYLAGISIWLKIVLVLAFAFMWN